MITRKINIYTQNLRVWNNINLLVIITIRLRSGVPFLLKEILISLHFVSLNWNLSEAAREANMSTAVWPGLLDAWLALTSVEYRGNLLVLTPTVNQRLDQRLPQTRLRATGPWMLLTWPLSIVLEIVESSTYFHNSKPGMSRLFIIILKSHVKHAALLKLKLAAVFLIMQLALVLIILPPCLNKCCVPI